LTDLYNNVSDVSYILINGSKLSSK